MAGAGKTEKITQTETDDLKKDFKGPAVTGKKSAPKKKEKAPAESETVTGEDVLPLLRKQGVKI